MWATAFPQCSSLSPPHHSLWDFPHLSGGGREGFVSDPWERLERLLQLGWPPSSRFFGQRIPPPPRPCRWMDETNNSSCSVGNNHRRQLKRRQPPFFIPTNTCREWVRTPIARKQRLEDVSDDDDDNDNDDEVEQIQCQLESHTVNPSHHPPDVRPTTAEANSPCVSGAQFDATGDGTASQDVRELQQQQHTQDEDEVELLELSQSRLAPPAVPHSAGLENPSGAQNCFLNAVLQALWHLEWFRQGWEQLLRQQQQQQGCHGRCDSNPASCVFCTLKNLYLQYTRGCYRHLPPQEVRQALSRSKKFPLGQQHDASELLEELLQYLHHHTQQSATASTTATANMPCNPPCLVHHVFAAEIIESSAECEVCHQTAEHVHSYTTLVHYFPAALLLLSGSGGNLESSLRAHYGSELRTCGTCQRDLGLPTQRVAMRKHLCNSPLVFAFVVAWPEASAIALGDDYSHAIANLPLTLRPSEVFHTASDPHTRGISYELVGLVCFYGRHYVAYAFSGQVGQWVYFDDAAVRVVEGNVRRGIAVRRQLPLILLYARPQ